MTSPTIWGMIHVPPISGSQNASKSFKEISDFCLQDAKILFENGIKCFFIENFGDAPFPKNKVEPHVIAALTTIINQLKSHFPTSRIGVNVLRNDALAALAIATITDCTAIRVNILTHARLTDQGIIEGCSYDLHRYKNQLNSVVEIWADVEVKHSYPLVEIPISEAILDMVERGGASKIIFTGSRTGSEVSLQTLQELVDAKIISPDNIVIGSGISEKNIETFLPYAKNFIVGSSLKLHNHIFKHIDPLKVSSLVSKIDKE